MLQATARPRPNDKPELSSFDHDSVWAHCSWNADGTGFSRTSVWRLSLITWGCTECAWKECSSSHSETEQFRAHFVYAWYRTGREGVKRWHGLSRCYMREKMKDTYWNNIHAVPEMTTNPIQRKNDNKNIDNNTDSENTHQAFTKKRQQKTVSGFAHRK